MDADAFNQTIGNVATPSAGGDCVRAADCTTTHPTPHYTLTKSSDPASGETVQPGGTITYTLTAHNDSQGVVSGAVVTDDLSDVLDDATLDAVPADASVSGTTLTWNVPTLQPGESATLSYTVTVNADAFNQTLHNVATPGVGGACVPFVPLGELGQAELALTALDDSEVCETTHDTPGWTLAKSSDPASGSTVQPGSTITYTLTATNVSNGVVSGATATDDLSAVLDHGTLDSVPSGATLSGTSLTWQIPELQPGDEATLTYSVTLHGDAFDVRVANVVTPGRGGRCIEACTTDHQTPPKPHEPNLPNTGGPGLAVVGLGVALLVGGGALMLRSRRRRGE